MTLKIKKTMLLLILILLIGGALRLIALGEEDLWVDEVASITYSDNNIIDLASGEVQDEGHPPLFYITLRLWRILFGDSFFALRVLPVLFSISSLYIIFRISKTLFDSKTALLSTLLMSTAMLQIVYAQELRSYSLLSFLALLSSIFFIDIVKSNKNFVPFIIILTLSFYTHYLTAILFVAYNIIFIALTHIKKESKNKLNNWIFSQIILFILIIPILIPLIKVSIFIMLRIIYIICSRGFLEISLIIALIILISFVLMLNKKNIRKTYNIATKIYKKDNNFLIALIILGISYIYVLDLIMSPYKMFLLRYTMFIFPIIYIVFAHRISIIKNKNIKTLLIISILIFNCFGLYFYYNTPTKEQWSKVAKLAENNISYKDIVLFDAHYMSEVFYYYYPNRLNSFMLLSGKDEKLNNINFTKTWNKIEDKQNIWLILSHNWRTGDYYKDKIEDKGYQIIETYKYKDIEVIKFNKKN